MNKKTKTFKNYDYNSPINYPKVDDNEDLRLFIQEIERLERLSSNKKQKDGYRYFEGLTELINSHSQNKEIRHQENTKNSHKAQKKIEVNEQKLNSSRKREPSDIELFLMEVEGVKRISKTNKFFDRPQKKTLKISLNDILLLEQEEIKTPEDYVKFSEDAFSLEHSSEYVEWVAPNVDKNLAKRLHKGEFSVQAYLDLHGYIVEDALKMCYEFFAKAIEQNKKCLAIIHGRGLSSEKGPIIKEAVIRWLKKGPFRRNILTFATAPRTDGGFGVTYVLLRRNKLVVKIK